MLNIVLGLACASLIAISVYLFTTGRNTSRSLSEYRELFEASGVSFKEAQAEIASYMVKLERGTHILETANVQILAQEEQLLEKGGEISTLQATLGFEQEQYAKLLGQKKSSEVRTGKITEQIAPFLSDYPFEPKRAKFIGDPIDIISFGDDKITFASSLVGWNAVVGMTQYSYRTSLQKWRAAKSSIYERISVPYLSSA